MICAKTQAYFEKRFKTQSIAINIYWIPAASISISCPSSTPFLLLFLILDKRLNAKFKTQASISTAAALALLPLLGSRSACSCSSCSGSTSCRSRWVLAWSCGDGHARTGGLCRCHRSFTATVLGLGFGCWWGYGFTWKTKWFYLMITTQQLKGNYLYF